MFWSRNKNRHGTLLSSLSLPLGFLFFFLCLDSPVLGQNNDYITDTGAPFDGVNSEPTNPEQTDSEDVAARIDEFLTNEVAEGRFSGSVLVADGGGIMLSKGYGMANIEHNVPNTPHTKFRICSISKQFTAMAIMILQERGLLTVLDPICIYVPDCPIAWEPVTIHHLLTNTSGIFNLTNLPDELEYIRLPRTIEETLARFKDIPLNFTPGERYEYSNSGYTLLGFIIELVSGQTFEDFLLENIFTPLGMVNTSCDDTRTILPDRAAGYTREEDTLLNAIHYEMGNYFGSAGLYSTVADLYLWDQALYATELVSQETLDAVFTPHVAVHPDVEVDMGRRPPELRYYGYGWFIGEQCGNEVVGHMGALYGFRAYIHRFPQEEICIIILCNFEFVNARSLTYELAAMVRPC